MADPIIPPTNPPVPPTSPVNPAIEQDRQDNRNTRLTIGQAIAKINNILNQEKEIINELKEVQSQHFTKMEEIFKSLIEKGIKTSGETITDINAPENIQDRLSKQNNELLENTTILLKALNNNFEAFINQQKESTKKIEIKQEEELKEKKKNVEFNFEEYIKAREEAEKELREEYLREKMEGEDKALKSKIKGALFKDGDILGGIGDVISGSIKGYISSKFLDPAKTWATGKFVDLTGNLTTYYGKTEADDKSKKREESISKADVTIETERKLLITKAKKELEGKQLEEELKKLEQDEYVKSRSVRIKSEENKLLRVDELTSKLIISEKDKIKTKPISQATITAAPVAEATAATAAEATAAPVAEATAATAAEATAAPIAEATAATAAEATAAPVAEATAATAATPVSLSNATDVCEGILMAFGDKRMPKLLQSLLAEALVMPTLASIGLVILTALSGFAQGFAIGKILSSFDAVNTVTGKIYSGVSSIFEGIKSILRFFKILDKEEPDRSTSEKSTKQKLSTTKFNKNYEDLSKKERLQIDEEYGSHTENIEKERSLRIQKQQMSLNKYGTEYYKLPPEQQAEIDKNFTSNATILPSNQSKINLDKTAPKLTTPPSSPSVNINNTETVTELKQVTSLLKEQNDIVKQDAEFNKNKKNPSTIVAGNTIKDSNVKRNDLV